MVLEDTHAQWEILLSVSLYNFSSYKISKCSLYIFHIIFSSLKSIIVSSRCVRGNFVDLIFSYLYANKFMFLGLYSKCVYLFKAFSSSYSKFCWMFVD